jgi:hypothetical protein
MAVLTRKAKNLYSVHPGVAMMQKWVRDLPEKTGRSLEEWIALTRKEGPATEKERREWLKREYKLGTNSAICIAERAEGKGTEEDTVEGYLKAAEEWVEAMFSGPKAALRPVYDELLEIALEMGAKASPGKTAVSLYRNHVFANLKPSTNTRIDVGLALGNLKTPKRLIDTGGFEKKDRITRRIDIRSKDEIDDDLIKWLRKAWDMDAS